MDLPVIHRGTNSLLAIILAEDISSWCNLNSSFMDFSQYVQVIISLTTQHLSLNEGNAITIIATGNNNSSFLYPTETSTPLVTHASPASIALFRSQLATQLAAFISSSSLPLIPPAHYSLAGALIRALLYIARVRRAKQDPKRSDSEDAIQSTSEMKSQFPARVLIVKSVDDSTLNARFSFSRAASSVGGGGGGGDGVTGVCSEYLHWMNAVQSAQKARVPVDALCCLSAGVRADTPEQALLQQAADLTRGRYLRLAPDLFSGAGGGVGGDSLNAAGVAPREALLFHLLHYFLPGAELRAKQLPVGASQLLDYRASCVCHQRLVDIGHVCSVCLAVYCSFVPFCSVCMSTFKPSGMQMTRREFALNRT